MQSRFQLTPSYRLVAETGPDHDKTFTVEVLAGSRVLGKGTGKSKKLAETEAARTGAGAAEGGLYRIDLFLLNCVSKQYLIL